MTHGTSLVGAAEIALNCDAPVGEGLLALAVATQPLVPPSGIVQPLPPLTGFSFSGTAITFPLSGSASPGFICTGRDGNIWTTFQNLEEGIGVFRVTPEGEATFFAISGMSEPYGICAGPDGNLYVTDQSGDNHGIYQLMLDGTSSLFIDLTTAGSTGLVGICAGADGNLWVADHGAAVFRVTVPGAVATKFDLTTGVNGRATCAGPDGNIWVCDNSEGPGTISRVTPAGEVSNFTIAAGHQFNDLCAGPDGNIWVTDSTGNAAVKVTPNGAITSFPIDGAGQLLGICSGGGGDLWITDIINSTLYKVTTEGVATPFDLPDGGQWICVGTDGSFWIGANSGGVMVSPFIVQTGGLSVLDGLLFLEQMPTADPSVAGQVWSNSGVLTISAG